MNNNTALRQNVIHFIPLIRICTHSSSLNNLNELFSFSQTRASVRIPRETIKKKTDGWQ